MVELPTDILRTFLRDKDSYDKDHNHKQINKKIQITNTTEYLGSENSSLLDNIGKISNKKLAIILNKFGDSSVIETYHN